MKSFAVIPAAGFSKRMGEPKLLMPWGQTTVIEKVIGVWNTSDASKIVVVVRSDDEPLLKVCRSLDVDIAIPDTSPPEMKDSVACGLRYVEQKYSPSQSDVWLLAPADMPGLSPRVIDRLLAEHDSASPAVLVPTHGQKRGHPVLFPWPLAAEVHHLSDDEGVNALLSRHEVRKIACGDSAVAGDIDTPEDYRKLKNERQ